MYSDDGFIIQECLNGESEAFGVLVDKYKAGIYAFVYSKLGDFHDAQDVTQEVFLQAYRNLRNLRRWESFSSWLYRIAYSWCRRWIQSRARHSDVEFIEDQIPETLEAASVKSYRENALNESLRVALDSLSDTYREVLILRYFGGMNSVEIAKALGTSPTAIRMRLSRARALLREEMVTMMDTAFEGQRLQISFTFRIVEAVKHIKIHPMPRMTGLPWGLSLAVGIILTVLRLGPSPDILSPKITIMVQSPGHAEMVRIGEIPVDVLTVPEEPIFPGYPGELHGEDPSRLGSQGQAASSMAPAGQEEYTFVRSWPEEILGLRTPLGIAAGGSGSIYVADSGNDRIQVFNPDGNLLKTWGTYGSGNGQFNSPQAITLDGSGRIYVADSYNHRIQVLDSDGNFLKTWGTYGSGNGQFNSPIGIAVDGSGGIYVVDQNNNRIQKLDSDGNFVIKWGSEGSGDGQFKWPRGIAVDGAGNVYVTDYNNRVQKFNSVGNFLTKWGATGGGNGQFNYPCGVVVDRSGFVYVADNGNVRVQKFDSNGNFLDSWGFTGEAKSGWPQGIATDGSGNIYVTEALKGCVHKFDSDGKFLMKWGGSDINGQLNSPYDVALDSSGNVYVVDYFNNRIQKFDSKGKFLTKWGTYGQGDGQFNWPVGIAVDSSSGVYVVDTMTHRIQKFDLDGKFLTKWGSWGPGDGQLGDPRALAVDKSGDIYVTERANCRVQVFDSKGKSIMKWGTQGAGDGQFSGGGVGWGPDGIAVDSLGNVYVADTDSSRIQKFDSKGRFLTKWGTEGSDDGQFSYPAGIAVDGSGNVYVADTGNNRIQLFDSKGNFLTKWGTEGAGEMEFTSPSGIAMSGSGEIYVADRGNNRIKVYRQIGGGAVEPGGKQLGKWGEVKRTELLQNFPNPFNPETWIPFTLSEPERVKIGIYGSTGQLIRTLDLGQTLPGAYLSKEKAAYWDGRNETGETVASDVYFYAMEAGGYKSVKKMILVR